jgi:Sulfotransferase family
MPDKVDNFAIVFSALRSGTTVLRLMLDAHSSISSPEEVDFIFDYLAPNPQGEWHYDVKLMQRDRMYKMADVNYPTGMDGLDALSGMVDQMHRPGELPILMLHRGLRKALAIAPGVKIIHMVRDPRDVANSSIGMGWAGNVFFGVDHWMETESEWADCDVRMSPDQVLTVSYEALIAAADVELARIVAFLGLSYEPGMLKYAEGTTYTKPDVSLIEQWRRKLTPYDIGLVEGKIGRLLQACGYQPSGHPEVIPGPWHRFRLMIQNRRLIWGVKFARFGIWDPLIAGFAKRLHMPFLAVHARARIDEKTMKYLK